MGVITPVDMAVTLISGDAPVFEIGSPMDAVIYGKDEPVRWEMADK